MLKKPRVNGRVVAGVGSFPVDDAVSVMFPCLFSFVTSEVWPEDGSVRVPGTCLFFLQDGSLKVMLKDREQGLVAFWTGASLQGLLESVEADLESGVGDWRRDKAPPSGRKTRGEF